MKLINMQVDKSSGYPVEIGQNNYDYGLSIHLNEEQCELLGISTALKAGVGVTLQAKAIVTRSTQALEQYGDDKGTAISLCLQITDLGINEDGVVKNAAQMLYGKS